MNSHLKGLHAIPTAQQNASGSLIRRYMEAAALIAVWMICGWLFRLSTPAYLVLGVPLVGLFQVFVRRRPLQELWVRDPGQPFRLDRLGWVMALALLVMPIYYLFTVALPLLLEKLVFYFAASFTLEEVAFRGALDSHVYPLGETNNRVQAWGSALFVSIVWGLWHLPLAGEFGMGFLDFLVIALFVEILEGIPLSFCWRQGGTLVLPAIAHALIDAYRDALMP